MKKKNKSDAEIVLSLCRIYNCNKNQLIEKAFYDFTCLLAWGRVTKAVLSLKKKNNSFRSWY